MSYFIFLKKVLMFSLIFSLLFIPQQKVFSNLKNDNHEKIELWIKQNNPLITSFNTTSLNNDYKLINYTIKDDYYGYLVISNDFEIIEYGEGSNIPYLPDIVINTDIEKNKLKNIVYFSPIENYWLLNIYNEKVYIEGHSGEWLIDLTNFKGINHNKGTIDFNNRISEEYINNKLVFDPYENFLWLYKNDNLLIKTEIELKKMLHNNQKVLFNGKKYNEQAEFNYSIIGYQSFDNNLFIATYDSELNLIRYISYNNLINHGEFLLQS